jgi:hypothetical protein
MNQSNTLTMNEIAQLVFKSDDVIGFDLDQKARRLCIRFSIAGQKFREDVRFGPGQLLLQNWKTFEVHIFDDQAKQWRSVNPTLAQGLSEIDSNEMILDPKRSIIHGMDHGSGGWTAYIFHDVELSARASLLE